MTVDEKQRVCAKELPRMIADLTSWNSSPILARVRPLWHRS